MATEQTILASLGLSQQQITAIMNGTSRLLLLDASAHLDWDWLLPFPTLTKYINNPAGWGSRAYWYFNQNNVGCVNDILTSATSLLSNPSYRYSTCETGFLRGFAQVNPAGFQALIAAGASGNRYRSEGGGITSPDNLYSHGEAFIRNYLLGHYWLSQNAPGIPPGQVLWIPDDFGHDPELPVVAQAMGMIAAGFERLPGSNESGGSTTPINGGDNLATQILNEKKIDFNWTAADGSSMSAHWLLGGYGYANSVASNGDVSTCLDTVAPVSPTPYIFLPVLSDFSMPNTQLVSVVDNWNDNPPSPYQNVIAVCGSFEVYAQLLQFHTAQMNAPYSAEFNANPFWTGCCASHTAVKIYHQRVTRKLLEAEAFSILAQWAQPGGGSVAVGTGNPYASELQQAWESLVPSTHHDYIPGTSIPDVFHGEQMTLLRSADSQANALLDDIMRTIADAITPNTYSVPVVVFNGLGFSRSSISELTAKQVADTSISTSNTNVQATAEGGMLFATPNVPSFGYQTFALDSVTLPENTVSVTPSQTGPVSSGTITLTNGLVTASLTQDGTGNWGLTNVFDVNGSRQLVPQGAVMNELLFYADGGDEYMLGIELDDTWELTDVSSSLSNPAAEILEAGPLRVVVRTSITYNDGTSTIDYIRDYILYANEPMLRMRSTGAAPMLTAGNNAGSVVMTSFPLQDTAISTLVRGTPYHWTQVMPEPYWYDQTFIPTHNFMVPVSNGDVLCGMYHSDIPGWGFATPEKGSSNSQVGTLYGMLWRNGDAHYYGWTQPPPDYSLRGSDPDVHVRDYALRMPSSLPTIQSGQLLQESLAFSTPLRAVVPAPVNMTLPDSLSVVSTNDSGAVITAVKPGTVNPNETVFRIYQPTNASLACALTVNKLFGAKISAVANTALEQPASGAGMNIQVSANTIYFDAPNALTTLSVSSSNNSRK